MKNDHVLQALDFSSLNVMKKVNLKKKKVYDTSLKSI